MFFTNINYGGAYLDTNITIEGMNFHWTNATGAGASHNVRFFGAQTIKVIRCIFNNGGDAIALIGCDDTLISGCSAFDYTNCAYDHWGGATNARIIGNFATSAHNTLRS